MVARGSVSPGGSSGEALRFLVIDESQRDRELIGASLRGAFANPEIAEVTDPAQLDAQLAAGKFDIVLADHRPSWIDAFTVLGKVRERFPYVPVILCTGTGSEELAVAAMKAGFDDYVLKHPHHFPRLASAIRSALEEAMRRRNPSSNGTTTGIVPFSRSKPGTRLQSGCLSSAPESV